MEEQNNITPWKYIKQHWKLILLVFLFPIMINALTFIPNFQVFEKPNSWTEVWAEYGGALLSAGIALVILYKQHKQNHEENEANRKQNELQNKLNLNLQINALKYQQKYNWYFELKHAFVDFKIACDNNIIRGILYDIYNYYKLTDQNKIDKAKSEIKKSIDDCTFKINSYHTSYLFLLNQEEIYELNKYLEILEKDVCYYIGILNNLGLLINIIENPVNKKMSEDEIKKIIDRHLKNNEKELEKLDEYDKLVKKIILNEYLVKYKYDFYGKTWDILILMFKDFENNVKSRNKTITEILQYERDKIDKLLDVEEINKKLNAN